MVMNEYKQILEYEMYAMNADDNFLATYLSFKKKYFFWSVLQRRKIFPRKMFPNQFLLKSVQTLSLSVYLSHVLSEMTIPIDMKFGKVGTVNAPICIVTYFYIVLKGGPHICKGDL